MMAYCWHTVADGVPTVNQHRVNVSPLEYCRAGLSASVIAPIYSPLDRDEVLVWALRSHTILLTGDTSLFVQVSRRI